jgi:ribosomal protein S1
MTEQEIMVAMPETERAGLEQQPHVEPPVEAPANNVTAIADLEPGMQLTGKVKSVTEFGAFVDLGVGPQGLVHISQLARRRVEKVADVVQVGEEVQVWVKKVDKKRGRISLTMVKPASLRLKDLQENAVVPGVVTRIEPYGVFLDIGTGRDGMVHVSALADGYVGSPGDVVALGDRVEARVINVDRKARKVDLSTKEFIKVAHAPEPEPVPDPVPVPAAAKEEEKPAPTIMALAFQAAVRRQDSAKRQRGIEKLIARRLRR